MRPLLFCAITASVVACGSSSPSTSTPVEGRKSAARAGLESCDGHAFAVRASAPTTGGPRATLEVSRRGEGMRAAAKETCVEIDGRVRVLARGERAEFEIDAHPTRWQRLSVGGRTVLLPIPPGGVLAVVDQPCFDWALGASWLDAFSVEAPNAYCRDPAATCRPGFVQPGPPGPVEEPLCEVHTEEDSERRCVRAAQVRFASAGESATIEHWAFGASTGESLTLSRTPSAYRFMTPSLMPGHCGLPEFRTASDSVLLAAPAAATVTLHVAEDGKLSAKQAPPPTSDEAASSEH